MFISIYFLIFLGIVAALYFLLPVKWRTGVLLLASYGFCAFIDWRSLVVLLGISVCVFVAAIGIEKAKVRREGSLSKGLTILAVGIAVLMLSVYKLVPYGLQRFGLDEAIPEGIMQQLVMPIGLSFYLFQAIGYLVDVYNGKTKAEKNFINLSLYFAFFAKFVSGPIERENTFIPQLKKLETVRFRNRGRLSTAFTYMLWGYFMKMVVADRLALTVGKIFDGAAGFDSLWLFLGMIFYTIQIYCDFAGYSYIAIGCGKIFGLNLTRNFKEPYLADSITDFWRRWHISLSSWLRDYLYIPLGGNRKGLLRKCANTIIVFLVCGIWHGAGFNFIAWGLLHGIFSVIDTLWQRAGWKRYCKRVVTFFAVAIAWIFFRASGFGSALIYVTRMVTAGFQFSTFHETMRELSISGVEMAVIWIGIILIGVVDWLCNKKKMSLPEVIQEKENVTRYVIFYLLIIAIYIFGMYGPGYHAEDFIYMQF